MNRIILSLAVCIVSAQSVLSYMATSGTKVGYNQVTPAKYNYGFSNGQVYQVGNNAYNAMNTQSSSPMVHGGIYGYQSNSQNYNHYNTNTQTTSASGRNYARKNSAMSYLPLLMGGLDANELTTYSMMMNSGTNNALSYLMMNGENNDLMRMMALRKASQGGRQLNPYTMSLLFGMEL